VNFLWYNENMRQNNYDGRLSKPYVYRGINQANLLGHLMYGKVPVQQPIGDWNTCQLSMENAASFYQFARYSEGSEVRQKAEYKLKDFQMNIYSVEQRAKTFGYGNVRVRQSCSYEKLCEFLK